MAEAHPPRSAVPGDPPRSALPGDPPRSALPDDPPRSALPDDPLRPVPYRARAVERETHDTWTLTLTPAAGPVPRFAPGQFSMLYTFGGGEVPISVSGDLAGDGPLVQTVRAVGAVTERICAARAGDVVGVRGPFGTAWPLADVEGRDVVVVAGGIGLAPLRPAIRHIAAHRDRYGRVAVLYGGRAPAELLYGDEIERWRSDGIFVDVTVDAAGADWRGKVGLVTKLVPRAPFDPSAAVALICGPEVMMRFTVAALTERGVDPGSIWVSLERSMKCGVGFCGHCQLGPLLVCRDGPVVRHSDVERWLAIREL